MSELQIILLASLLRAFLVSGLISRWDFHRDVLKAVGIGLVTSSVSLVAALMLYRPTLLLFGYMIESELIFQILVPLLAVACFVVPLWIEMKSNLAQLKESFSSPHIRRSTFWGHAFSTVMLLLWLWVTV